MIWPMGAGEARNRDRASGALSRECRAGGSSCDAARTPSELRDGAVGFGRGGVGGRTAHRARSGPWPFHQSHSSAAGERLRPAEEDGGRRRGVPVQRRRAAAGGASEQRGPRRQQGRPRRPLVQPSAPALRGERGRLAQGRGGVRGLPGMGVRPRPEDSERRAGPSSGLRADWQQACVGAPGAAGD
jgi:hypothetical protein